MMSTAENTSAAETVQMVDDQKIISIDIVVIAFF